MERMPNVATKSFAEKNDSEVHSFNLGNISVEIVEGSHAPTVSIGDFLYGFRSVLAAAPAMMFDISADDLRQSGSLFCFVRTADGYVAGARSYPNPKEPGIVIGSVWTGQQHRGNGYAGLGASALIAYETTRRSNIFDISCDIRVLPDGSLNEASAKVFTRLGFAQQSMREGQYTGTYTDAGFMDSLEANGESYRYLVMKAKSAPAVHFAYETIGKALFHTSRLEAAA